MSKKYTEEVVRPIVTKMSEVIGWVFRITVRDVDSDVSVSLDAIHPVEGDKVAALWKKSEIKIEMAKCFEEHDMDNLLKKKLASKLKNSIEPVNYSYNGLKN